MGIIDLVLGCRKTILAILINFLASVAILRYPGCHKTSHGCHVLEVKELKTYSS